MPTDRTTAAERLSFIIEHILRPSLLESLTREAQQRIDLGITLNPAMRGNPDDVRRSAAFERTVCGVSDWLTIAARRYGLDRVEFQAVAEAIDAGLPSLN